MRSLAEMTLVPGRGVDPETGRLVEDPSAACTWMPGRVGAGDVLRPRPGMEMLVLMYGGDPDPDLIYTYSYQDESNWAPYRPERSRATFSSDEFEVSEGGLARVVVRRPDGAATGDGVRLAELVEVERAPSPEVPVPRYFRDEARRVADRVAELRRPGDLVLLLVSDIHWAAGCPWDDTVRNLREVASLVSPDALVQLGDLTDGLVPAQVTREVVGDLLGDLGATGLPVYGCLGNHDANYFRGNPDSLGRRERSELYLGRGEPTYLVDFPEARVRALFLDSFDPMREERYGFSLGQLVWVARALATTPSGWSVVAFSHVPLLASMHVWSEHILHGVAMRRLLQAFDRVRGGALVTYVHGHNHADQVSYLHGFPIVSVGCAKIEDFSEHKPQGSSTPHRRWGDATQELWNVLVVSSETRTAHFVRFGAGQDLEVHHGRA